MHVLVVEDHELNRRLITMMLEEDEHRVDGAGSVSEVRAQVAREVPEVILMDIHLPDGDGLDLVRELRADPRFARVRMYAVTAHLMSEAGERARAVGCDGFFEKPLDTDALLAAVRG
jgi:CheY-like chemotaxis protein